MMGKATSGVVTVLAVLTVIEAYPVMGSGKRYSQRSWTYPPVVYQPRSTRFSSYYDAYVPDPVDVYYNQDPYDKYRVVLPSAYYMPDQYYMPEQYPEQYFVPEQRPEQYYAPEQHPEQYYYSQYEGEEPLPEEDELLDASWYNSPNADTNLAFLQNLVLAQLYRDASNKNQRYPTPPYMLPRGEDYDDDGATYVYGEQVKEVAPTAPPKEDKDVRDLKSLVDTGKPRPSADTGKQRRKTEGTRRSLQENRWLNKRDDGPADAQEPTVEGRKDGKGQDEVVMMRPAVPGRTAKFHQRSYQPSAYDAIKKLLIQQNNENRQPQKRSYVLNEDSLVEQLGKLKKSS